MPRRRLPPPPPERLAAILGMPEEVVVAPESGAASPESGAGPPGRAAEGASSAWSRDPGGWTPQRPGDDGATGRMRRRRVAKATLEAPPGRREPEPESPLGPHPPRRETEPESPLEPHPERRETEPESPLEPHPERRETGPEGQLEPHPERGLEEQRARRTGRHRRPTPPGPALLTVPESLRGLWVRPSRLAVLGLVAVALLAAVVLGMRVAWARSGAAPHPVTASSASGSAPRSVPAGFATAEGRARGSPVSGGSSGSTVGEASPAPSPSAAAFLLVHVVGQVRDPGVVRLRQGARVRDAVRAAGGATGAADLSGVNLARPVADGEQVVVPKPGEDPTPLPGAPPAAAAPPATGVETASTAPVDLNTATLTELEALPGVGPVLAQRILDWRTEHSRFSSVDELLEVSGIGDKVLADLRDHVRV